MSLTSDEQKALKLKREGKTNDEIGKKLGCSTKEVGKLLTSVAEKGIAV